MITNFGRTDQLCRLCRRAIAVPICGLPDDVLLEIFSIYVDCAASPHEDAWHTLVHVCRRWRYVVFASPQRLKLQLRCTNKRSAQMMLDVWPALPIVVEFRSGMSRPLVASNVITALNQRDRIRKIDLCPVPMSLLRKIRAIKEPLPMLTDLNLASNHESELSLHDSFLGGSAPRLRSLQLIGIPFPGLLKLLSSTPELVTLCISNIHSLLTSPEAVVTSLSTLTKLQNLTLGFQSYPSPADNAGQLLPSLTLARVVLPALTSLHFLSYDKYLEDIVSRIDTPLLDNMTIEPLKQRVLDTRRLRYFISHTEAFKPLYRADIDMVDSSVSLRIFSRGATADHELLKFTTSRKPSDYQLFTRFAQFCVSALPPLPTLERLEIRKSGRHWQDPIIDIEWLDLLRPFTSVRELVLSEIAARHIAPALRRGITVENVIDILPALQDIFMKVSARSGPTKEAIEQFVETRRLSDHPVTLLYED